MVTDRDVFEAPGGGHGENTEHREAAPSWRKEHAFGGGSERVAGTHRMDVWDGF